MGRAWIALAAFGLALLGLRAEEAPPSLSIALALPQRQDAPPGFGGGTDDAPRKLGAAGGTPCRVVLRNESDAPLRLYAGGSPTTAPGLSFRLVLDDGRSVPILFKVSFELDAFTFHPTLQYWLLQPGEPLVLEARLLGGGWAWDPRLYAGRRGTLVPVYDWKADAGEARRLALWTGHVEGRGVPVVIP